MATTPLRGRRYPLESDTPDVAADIHNLALDLENAPNVTQGILSARPSSSVAGNRYYVTGDSTATNNGVDWYDTGSGWIKAAQPYSEGTLALRPATAPSGAVYYATDKAQWYQYNGAWGVVFVSAAWQTLTLGSGITAWSNGYAASARITGDTVELSGSLKNNSGGVLNAGATLATLPSSSYAPAQLVSPTASTSGSSPASVAIFINASGTTILLGDSLPSGFGVYLDSLSYRLV